MRTDNGKVRGFIISVYFVLVIVAIILATVFSAFKDVTDNVLVTFTLLSLVFLVLFFSVHAIARYFEYDSDGIKVIIINRGLLLADKFNYREYKLEFYKKDLISFEFRNYYFFIVLKLMVKRSNGSQLKQRFNVTLVPRRKRKHIRQSLGKILRENKKKTQD
jgi:hypothetical protein